MCISAFFLYKNTAHAHTYSLKIHLGMCENAQEKEYVK